MLSVSPQCVTPLNADLQAAETLTLALKLSAYGNRIGIGNRSLATGLGVLSVCKLFQGVPYLFKCQRLLASWCAKRCRGESFLPSCAWLTLWPLERLGSVAIKSAAA